MYRSVGDHVYRTVGEALDDAGYVLYMETSGTNKGKVIKTTTSKLDVYGINYTSTKDNPGGTAQTGVEVAIIQDGSVEVKLSSTNAAIEIGQTVAATTSGVCDKYTATTTAADTRFEELSTIVGIAEEAKALNAGGKIKVKLRLTPGGT